MKKNRSILLVLMLTCLFIFPSNKQVIYGQSKVNTIISSESLTISNLTLNGSCFSKDQTLQYSFNVNGDFELGIWVTIEINFADGTKSTIKNQSYTSCNVNISGSYTIPSKIGTASLNITVRKYDLKYNRIYILPKITANRNIEIIAESLSVSNIVINNTITNETMNYSFDISGNIDLWIWVITKIEYADGTLSTILNQSYANCNTTISGSVNLPSETGDANLNISVHKFDVNRNVSFMCPSVNESSSFTIIDPPPFDLEIKKVSYHLDDNYQTVTLTIYEGEYLTFNTTIKNTGIEGTALIDFLLTPSSITSLDPDNLPTLRQNYGVSHRDGNIGQLEELSFSTDIGESSYTDQNYTFWIMCTGAEDGDAFVYDSDSYSIKIYHTARSTTKIINFKMSKTNEIINEINELKIYPNPSTGLIHLVANENLKNYVVDVYSLTGAKIYSRTLEDSENTIDLSNLETGLYIIKLEKDEVIYHQKIQIKK